MLFSILAFVMTVIVSICNRSSCENNYLPDIPCPNVFQYFQSGDKTIGIITVDGIRHGKTRIVVELSQPGAYNLANFGKLSLNLSKRKVFEYIDRGKALFFTVDFPLENIVPRITSIEVNDLQICSGPKYGVPSTTIRLEYTLTTFPSDTSKHDLRPSHNFWHPIFNESPNLINNQEYDRPSNQPIFNPSIHTQAIYNEAAPAPKFSENEQNLLSNYFNQYGPAEHYGPRNIHPTSTPIHAVPTQSPTLIASIDGVPVFTARPTPTLEFGLMHPKPSPRTVPESESTHRQTFEYINSVCGQENLNFNIKKLNVKGTVISMSRFPWISAVFKKFKGEFTFQCGGSLISTRTVVSAAHCFYTGFEVIEPENILISMGLHDLTLWADAYNIAVEKIIQHPDYNPTLISFDADFAIVRLKQSVIFTTSVRPICLWQGSLENHVIEGVSGAIVGWGADGNRNTTTVPTLVNATIVSEITCIRSNYLFISLTSNRTLCAGNLDGSGPCLGDSGNGLMIKMRNKWMLRGTVSAALGTPTRQCVLDQYAIYSDIAKFLKWIRSNMLL